MRYLLVVLSLVLATPAMAFPPTGRELDPELYKELAHVDDVDELNARLLEAIRER